MKNNKTPFTLRKEVVTVVSIILGGIMGGLLCSIGQNAGEYRGIIDTNNSWNTEIDKVIVKIKNKTCEEGEKEE